MWGPPVSWFFVVVGCSSLDPAPRLTPTAPAALPPSLDAVRFDCDADAWRVSADVVGRAATLRATVVLRDGTRLPLPVEPGEPVAADAVFQPFSAVRDDPEHPCARDGAVVLVEAVDASGGTVDCVALGATADDAAPGCRARPLR